MTFNALGTMFTRHGVQREWHPKIQGIHSHSPEVALVCTQDAWKGITGHITKSAELLEAQKREKATKKYLKEGSYEMKKNWANSVENLRKQRLKILEGKKAAAAKEQADYLAMVLKENMEEKDKYVQNMRNQLFYQHDDNKNLTSALLLTETLYEREAQIDFNKNVVGDIEKSEEVEYVSNMKKDVEKYHEEQKAAVQKRREFDLEHQSTILKQIKKNAELADPTDIIEEEKELLKTMAQRFKEIEDEEINEEIKKRQMTKCLLEEARRQRQEFESRTQAEEEEENRINEVFTATKSRISNMLKANLKKARQEKLKIIEDIGKKVFEKFQSGEAEEMRILEKCIADNNAKLDADIAARKAYYEKLAEEKRQAHADYIKEHNIQLDEEAQLRQWDMMNRMKNVQVYNAFLADEEKERLEKQVRIKEDLIKQRELDTKTRLDAEERLVNDFRQELERWKEHDKHFLEYAEAIIKDRREHGRNTLPLERVLNEFKIKHGYMESTRDKLQRENRSHIPAQKPGKRTTTPESDPTSAITKEVKAYCGGTLKSVKRNER